MQAALVLFKVHRFEALVAFVVPLGLAVWATITAWQLDALGVPAYCIRDWLIDGPALRPECGTQMRSWGAIASATDPFFLAMGVAPMAIGLLAGVPIIARELEAGSAAFSWWLFPSRLNWLTRQSAAVGLPFFLSVTVAAFAANLVANPDHEWGMSGFQRIGLHGGDLIAHAAAAFGIGMLAGSVSGRTLPGFILGAFLVGAVALGIALGRDAWIASLEPTAIGVPDPVSGELVVQPRSVFSRWGSLDGNQVMLGVSEDAALGWDPLDTVLYGSVALVTLASAAIVVHLRRPN